MRLFFIECSVTIAVTSIYLSQHTDSIQLIQRHYLTLQQFNRFLLLSNYFENKADLLPAAGVYSRRE